MTLHSVFMNTEHFICVLKYNHIIVYSMPAFSSRLDEIDLDSGNEVSLYFFFSLT